MQLRTRSVNTDPFDRSIRDHSLTFGKSGSCDFGTVGRFLIAALLALLSTVSIASTNSVDEINTVLFSTGFESTFPPPGWVIGDGGVPNNTGYHWGLNTVNAQTGTYSAFCASNDDTGAWTYLHSMRKVLQTPTFDLSAAVASMLHFSVWMNTEADNDQLIVAIRDPRGIWQNLRILSGSAQSWQTFDVSLWNYIGQNGVAIQFVFTSNGSTIPTGNAGVWLDNVSLEANLATVGVTLTNPTGGENWGVGSRQEITWYANGFGANDNMNVEINREYSGGTWTLLGTVPNSGSFPWTVTNPIGSTNRIKVYPQSNASIYGMSTSNFTISGGVTPVIQVTTPAGGEHWYTGEQHTIQWTSTNLTDNVQIDLKADTTTTVHITNSTPNSGSYTWSIPTGLVASTAYRIYISNATSPVTADDYSSYFSIAAGQVNYTISGYVRDSQSNGISGVSISGMTNTVTTDQNGYYSGSVSSDWSGTLTPSLTGYTFSPQTITLSHVTSNQTSQNFTATPTGSSITISGYVRNSASNAISGVTISGLPGIVQTDNNGFYSATVSSGWSGTVTPSLSGWTFAPTNRTYNGITVSQSSQNYTATQVSITYFISGYVRDTNSQPIANVVMSGFPNYVTTDANGFYQTFMATGWSGTVTPQLTGYSFVPDHYTYTALTGNLSGQNYTGTLATSVIISGYIRNSSSNPISGVTLSGLPGTIQSDNDGFYSATVSSGWSGTVTPTLSGWSFAPTNRTYSSVTTSQFNQNFTATQVSITYFISGHVRNSSSQPIANVVMSGFPSYVATDTAGFYQTFLAMGWSGTVTPQLTGYTFSPDHITFSALTGNQTAQNFTATLSTTAIISGIIRDQNLIPIAGVAMAGFPGSIVTNASGVYTVTLSRGWSGTVTPQLVGWNFTPSGRTYFNVSGSQTTENYSGTPNGLAFTISGFIRDVNSVPISGVAMTGFPSTILSDTSGYYIGTVPRNWSGAISPQATGRNFEPVSRSYSNITSNVVNNNYTAVSAIQYIVSGHVLTSSGTAVSGVELTGYPYSVVTDQNGSYSALVHSGWNGLIVPRLTGYSFTPVFRNYTGVVANMANEDFVATVIPTFTISGYVRYASGRALRNVQLKGLPSTVRTDSTGFYTATVSSGWSGAISPTRSGWIFQPPSRGYTNLTTGRSDQNYTCLESSLDIGGYIHNSRSEPLADVRLFGLPGVVVTDSNGDYTITIPQNWTGTVTPQLEGWNFTPSSRSYTNYDTSHYNEGFAATATSNVIVSGYIQEANNLGTRNVSISGFPMTVYCDQSGYYSCAVPNNWSGTISPQSQHWSFFPPTRAFYLLTSSSPYENFTASRTEYEIAGTILDTAGEAMAGLSISGFPTTVVTQNDGTYSVFISNGWSGVVTPASMRHSFAPVTRTYTNVQSDILTEDYVATPLFISIDYPNGPGITWSTATNQFISWFGGTPGGTVTIELNRNYPTGTWSTIRQGTGSSSQISNTGRFDWLVYGPRCEASARFRITDNTTQLQAMSNFNLQINDVSINRPTASDIWLYHGTGIIDWDINQQPNLPVDIILVRDGTWIPIIRNTANSGHYEWFVTAQQSANCQVYVKSVGDNDYTRFATSPTFTILGFDAGANETSLPKQFAMHPASPNPFNSTVSFRVDLPTRAVTEFVIYDVRGATVREQRLGTMNPGTYQFQWDGRNQTGNSVPSGLYIVHLRSGEHQALQKVVLVK